MIFLWIFALCMVVPALELAWGLTFGRNKFIWSKWFWQLVRFVIIYIVVTAIWLLDIPYITDNNMVFVIVAGVAYALIDYIIEKKFNKNG